MQSKYYRLNQDLNANKIMHDIKHMVQDHARVNKLEDTILHIEIKDITYSHEEGFISDDRKNTLPE
jgi:hypothetical protein|tara:strand:+ start:436 stop:633 length:198 start_codon:yes stop_codon:yes gene_type:complete